MRNSSQRYRLNIVTVLGVLLGVLMTAPMAYAQPENDNIANAIVISALDFTDTRDTSTATVESDEPPTCFGTISVWYVLTPTEDRIIRADIGGSNYFAFIDVYTGSPGSLSLFACGQQSLQFAANAGTTYFFRVQGGGDLVFSVLDLGPPFTLDLSIDPAVSVNSKTGAAIVRGTVTCNQPAGVSVDVLLRQKVGRKTIIQGFSRVDVECNGETPWSTTVRSDQGAFGGGTAEVIASASGCGTVPSCDDAQAESIIKLGGNKQ